MMDPVIFQRNVDLITKRLEKQIAHSLKKGNDYIDQELSNPLTVMLRPIIKMFYNSFARKDIEEGSRDNIKVCIEAAKEVVLHQQNTNDIESNIDTIDTESTADAIDTKSSIDTGDTECITDVSQTDGIIDIVIEKYFPKYLKGDQTARNLIKTHKNYNWCVDNTKKVFRAQIEPLIRMLKCQEEVSTYDELVVKTFKTPEVAREVLTRQLTHMENGLNKVKSDPMIINVPAGRELILNVLDRGFQDTKHELIGDIDIIFDTYS
jgi:hypothetical protein